jgi:hypothetical protein
MSDPIYNGIVLDRGGEVINVRAYGIDNTGGANVTSAVQTLVETAPDFATLVFPPGIYRLSGITLYRPIRLMGPGTLRTDTTGGALVSVSGAEDVTIEGLTFQTATFTGGAHRQRYIDAGLGATNSRPARLTIRGNRFLEGPHTNAIRVLGAPDLGIESNDFVWSQHTASITETGTEANGMIMVNGSTGAVLRGNRLRRSTGLPGGARGIVVLGSDDVQITNNILEVLDESGDPKYSLSGDDTDTATTGIQLWSSRGSPVRGGIIAGNTLVGGNGARIYLKNDVLGSVVSGNVIRPFNGVGIGAISIGDRCDHTVVSDNVIEGPITSGQNIQSDGIILFGLDMEPGETRLDVAAKYCLVHGNSIRHCRHAVRFGGARHQIRDNVLSRNSYQQLFFEGYATGCHAYDNLLESTPGFGSPYGGASGNSQNVLRLVSDTGVETYLNGEIMNPV